ncbi:MAG: ArnT family glycosyltransferase [Solirubrobacterales bacterium]
MRPLAAILLLALLFRLGAVVADTGYAPQNDSLDYDRFARSIAAGDGYPSAGFMLYGGPTAIRPPGYPVLLGAVYAASGDSVTAGRIAGALLGALAVYLIYLIARAVWGRRTALFAAALAAVFPPLVLLSRELFSESLFIVLELAAVLSVFAFRRSGGLLRWALAAGLLCGAATLTRNVGLALIVPVAIGMWRSGVGSRAAALAGPAVVLASVIVLLVPWTVRNEAEFGRFIPISDGTGFTLAGTYNRQSYEDGSTHGGWRTPQVLPQFERLFTTRGIDEAEADETLRRRALDFAWEHPAYVVEASAWNLLRMFELSGGSVVDLHGRSVQQRGIGSETPLSERIGLAIVVLLAALGVAAIVASGRRAARTGERRQIPRGPLFLWLVPVLALLSTAPLGGLPRYRLAADPFLLLLAGVGLAWATTQLSIRRGAAA